MSNDSNRFSWGLLFGTLGLAAVLLLAGFGISDAYSERGMVKIPLIVPWIFTALFAAVTLFALWRALRSTGDDAHDALVAAAVAALAGAVVAGRGDWGVGVPLAIVVAARWFRRCPAPPPPPPIAG